MHYAHTDKQPHKTKLKYSPRHVCTDIQKHKNL